MLQHSTLLFAIILTFQTINCQIYLFTKYPFNVVSFKIFSENDNPHFYIIYEYLLNYLPFL